MACHSFSVRIINFCIVCHIARFYIAVLTLAFIILMVSLPAVLFWGRSTVDITQTTVTQWHPQKSNIFFFWTAVDDMNISLPAHFLRRRFCVDMLFTLLLRFWAVEFPQTCAFLFDASFKIIKSRKIKSLFILEDLSKWMQATIPVTVWRGKLKALRVSFNIHEKSNVSELF